MAEVIFKGRIRRLGRHDVTVSSAGLIDMKGKSADRNAVDALLENGFEEADHRSTLLTEDAVTRADLIVVMEGKQKKLITEAYPHAEAKIRLLKSFTKGYMEADSDIRDPYRMSAYHYRLCFSEIYLAVEGMMRSLE